MNPTMVSVPKELLSEVLDNALSDSYSTEAEFSCTADDEKYYANQRKLIRELETIACLDASEATGRGFFAVAAALYEQNETNPPSPPSET